MAQVRKLQKGLDEIRSVIAAAQTPFGKSTPKEKKARVERQATDLEFFAQTYFPHYLTKPPSKMHKAFYQKFQEMIISAYKNGVGAKDAEAAPRGNAKSTIISLILPLWCIVNNYRKFIVLLSDTSTQATEFLEFIKAELELNDRLREDFPGAVDGGKIWQQGHIITQNGVKVRTYGTGQKLRGARSGPRRPDLIIGDDLENDENVESHDQRKKTESWFFKAVMKAGAEYTVYLIGGTILHYDSLLSKILKRPGWTGQKWQAVVAWSTSPLWEEWERVFLFDRSGTTADEFFESNKTAMLEGTEVLWPEGEPYYYLMKMRVSDGPAFFDSEKQNEPINPEECLFNDEDFRYWEEDDHNHEGLPVYATCDPSMGKKGKKNDPSAILVGVKDINGFIDVLEADIQRRHPDKIIADLINYDSIYKFHKLRVEEVQFQEFFKDETIKRSQKNGRALPVEGYRPTSDKLLRISRLQPYVRNGVVRFRRNQRTLIDQLRFFPKAAHDDGPDALEMLVSLIEGGVTSVRVREIDLREGDETALEDEWGEEVSSDQLSALSGQGISGGRHGLN